MALPELSTMKDEDYKKLSQEQLMMYNKDLPRTDYEHPYSHQEFPKHLYRIRDNPDGSKVLASVVIDTRKSFDAHVKDGWRESPADFGIETAPGAPLIKDTGFEIAIPQAVAIAK